MSAHAGTEADAAILDINTGKRVLIAGDINQPISAREAAVKDGVAAITAAVADNTITRRKLKSCLPRRQTTRCARSASG